MKRHVTRKQGKDLARKYNCPFVEVSAVSLHFTLDVHELNGVQLTGENIDDVFSLIVEELKYGKKVTIHACLAQLPLTALQKDPFIQEYPYYKKDWKELIQVPPQPPSECFPVLQQH
jgi:hypothetical protein